jgi:F-type H+-transporting ATPase subunit delta
MNESLITVRYVKALFELANERKLLKEVEGDMQTLLTVIRESKEFNDFLSNPIIKISEKLTLTRELFAKQFHVITMQFLKLLIENKREMYLKNICFYFISYYKQNLGIKEATLTTARTLPKQHRDEIHRFITRKFRINVELAEKVEPDIIGGFVLRIDDQQINASIRAQLNKIRRELIHT